MTFSNWLKSLFQTGDHRRRSQRRHPARRRFLGRMHHSHALFESLESRLLLAFGPVGPEFLVNQSTVGNQQTFAGRNSVSVDSLGNYVMTWTSATATGLDVFARRFNAAGQALGSEIPVNTMTTGTQSDSSVAVDANGNFVVVWTSGDFPGTRNDVYARRFNAAGVPQDATEFRVNDMTTGMQWFPAVGMSPNGAFAVTWSSDLLDGLGHDVYLRTYNAAGDARTGDVLVNSTHTTGQQLHSSVDIDGNGDVAVAFQAQDIGETTYHAEVAVFDFVGRRNNLTFACWRGYPGSLLNPTVSMDAAGNFVVACTSDTFIDDRLDIVAERFNSAGFSLGDPFQVNTTTADVQLDPNVALDVAGNFVISWTSRGQDGSGDGIYARRYDASGSPQGNEFQVNSFAPDNQQNSSVTLNGDGDILAVWTSESHDGSGTGVYGQRFSSPPTISEVSLPGDIAPVAPLELLHSPVGELVVAFSKNMNSSVLDVANWQLIKDGQPAGELLANITFGWNAITERYEAQLRFLTQLPSGDYLLTAMQSLQDAGGANLDGNIDGVPGGDYSLAFSVGSPLAPQIIRSASGSPTGSSSVPSRLGVGSHSALSDDGRYLVFVSDAPDVVPGQVDSNGLSDVFLYDRETNKTVLVSHSVAGQWNAGDLASADPVISGDGHFIVFTSRAKNLIPEFVSGEPGTNVPEVFLYNIQARRTTLVSQVPGFPTKSSGSGSADPAISDDGRYVVYHSFDDNLVAGQTESIAGADVFLYDRTNRSTKLVSHNSSNPRTVGNGSSGNAVISGNGRFVAYRSGATDIVTGKTGLMLFDATAGTTVQLATVTDPQSVIISDDGSSVIFMSADSNLVANQVDPVDLSFDLFLYDVASHATELVSHAMGNTSTTADAPSWVGGISSDGQYVAYTSEASNLVANDSGGMDVFVFDRDTRQNQLVSQGNADFSSSSATISGNGQVIAFVSDAPNLVAGQQTSLPGASQVFLFDTATQSTTLVSRGQAGPTTTGNGSSFTPMISHDGNYVAFSNNASDLVVPDSNSAMDVFLYGSVLSVSPPANQAPDSYAIRLNGDFVEMIDSQNQVLASQLVSATTNVVINAEDGQDDLLTLDFTHGNPIPTRGITFHGGTAGNDGLKIVGTGSQDGVYAPDPAAFGSGTIFIDGHPVHFTGLEPVDVSDLANFVVAFPGGDDDVSISDGFDFFSGGQTPALRLSGTSGGLGFESLAVWNVGTLTVDTASGQAGGSDGNDTVTINSTSNDHGNSLTILTGGGADFVEVNGVSVDFRLDGGTVVENAAQAVVGTLSSTNPAGEPFSNSILPGLDGAEFSLAGNQLLTGLNGLDYESGATRSVTIRTTHASGLFFDKTFIVQVINVSDSPPAAMNLDGASVPENAPLALVGTLSTTDPDPGESFTYSIRPGADGSLFMTSGDQLRVGAAGLDFEAAATRTVIVRTTDVQGLYLDRAFDVQVTNVNEVPTGITWSTVSGKPPLHLGPEFQVNTYTEGSQRTALQVPQSVAMDADGDFVVTWASAGQDGSGDGVYAQRFNAAAVPQGSEFRVNTFVSGDQLFPTVAMDPDGDFIISWSSKDQDGSGYGVYAQRYNASGTPLGGEFRINRNVTANDQRFAMMAMGRSGESIATWSSFGQDGSGDGVYAQRYDADGLPLGDEFRVNTTTFNSQRRSTVAMDADGDFVIIWTSVDQDGSSYGVYANRYNAAGVSQGGEFRVNTTTVDIQRWSRVAMDANGNFAVTWTSNLQDGSGTGVYVQRYNAAGARLGGEVLVNSYTNNNQQNPSIAVSPDANFVISWTSTGQDGSGDGIYAQRFNSAGILQGGEFPVNTYTPGGQRFSTVAMDADGDFVVIWSSDGQDGSSYGVYGQRYTAVNNQVSENEPHASVGTLKTADPDVADTVSYSIVPGEDGSEFVLVGNQIMVGATGLDYEAGASRTLIVRATDAAGLYIDQPQTVLVSDANEAPSQISISNSAVDETAPPGTVVGRFTTTDPDFNDSFEYTIQPGQDGLQFTISGNQLLVGDTGLDYEAGATRLVTVRTTDASGLFHEQSFSIQVLPVNVPPIVHVSGPTVAVVGQLLTFLFQVSDSDSPADFSLDIDWDHDDVLDVTTAVADEESVRHVFAAGSFAIRGRATDAGGDTGSWSGELVVQVEPVTPATLEQALTDSGGQVTLEAATQSAVAAVVEAVNGLTPPALPVAVTVDLGGGTFTGIVASPPANVTLTFINGTFVGASPALTVTSGTVHVVSSTLSNSMNSPTILVTGGQLAMRGTFVRESTSNHQAAIQIAGGSLDLGQVGDPGNNVIAISGVGELIRNTGSSPVSALGNSFLVDGTPIDSAYRIENLIFHALDAGGGGLVTYLAGNVFVTKNSGSIQRGINAVTDAGTVNVETNKLSEFVVGSRLLTVRMESGPTLALVTDLFDCSKRSLVVTGTDSDENIDFSPRGESILAKVGHFPAGLFSPDGRIVAVGEGGRDSIQVASSIVIPAWLSGGAGDDRLQGGAGDDAILGDQGNDELSGGDGNDTLHDSAGDNEIRSGNGDDILFVGDGNNLIRTDNGNASVTVGDGNNEIHAGQGINTIIVGAGDNRIWTRGGVDSIHTGDGDNEIHSGGLGDTIVTGGGNDKIWTSAGDDYVDAGDGDNEIHGGGGNDTLLAGSGGDRIWGDGGNDIIRAGDGINIIFAGAGMDDVATGNGVDEIDGEAGDDILRAGSGSDSIRGGAGNDILLGNEGNDTLDGGDGRDILIGGGGADRLTGNQQDDVLIAAITAFDNNDLALRALRAEWTSSRSAADRWRNLSGNSSSPSFASRLNQNYFLVGDDTPSQTVFDDGISDHLTGQQGSDLFFAELDGLDRDLVTDLASADLTADIDS